MKHRFSIMCIQLLCFFSFSLLHTQVQTSLHLLDKSIPWSQPNTDLASNSPATFGKTHFIFGYPNEGHRDIPHVATKKKPASMPFALADNGVIKEVFFSPDDDIRSKLIYLIDQEQERIKVAIFNLTDRKIAQALLEAHKRGIRIELITDSSCLRDRYNQVTTLCDSGLNIFIYNPSHAKGAVGGCMHHKFILFGKNIFTKSLIWTGSFNFTKAACQYNQENSVVLEDRAMIDKFAAQFERLKTRSHRYGQSNKRQSGPVS